MPVAKAFEQSARDEPESHGVARNGVDAVALASEILDDTPINPERYRKNRQLREKLARAIVQELRATPPRTLADRLVVDVVQRGSIEPTALATKNETHCHLHGHGEGDLAQAFHLWKALEDDRNLTVISFIRDIDAVVIALLLSVKFHERHGEFPCWLVAYQADEWTAGDDGRLVMPVPSPLTSILLLSCLRKSHCLLKTAPDLERFLRKRARRPTSF